ncbi:MAG: hypothetical protein COA79_25210 [Planctomycetota bacterium]|nr:MAG: hypothetical protein COA79_25210 [Planctomycetota bacterium]
MSKHTLEICFGCGLAKTACFCAKFKNIPTEDRVTIITTQTENKIRSNTGRWLHKMLENSKVIYLGDENWEAEVEAEKKNASFYPILFYPSPNSLMPREKRREVGKPFNIFLLDTGWRTARRWIYKKIFAEMPRLELKEEYESRYFLRSVPKANHLCSLQSLACLLVEINNSYLPAQNDLMNTMDIIVKKMATERGTKIKIDGEFY